MATVNKDFRVKHGLVVEGTNATVDGSDIITEDAITGGTQTNISVTYNPTTKVVDFVAESGLADGDTDDLDEGDNNLYFTDARARDAISDGNGISYDSSTGVISAAVEGDGGLGATVDGLSVKRSVVDTWYDAAGAAGDVQDNLDDHTEASSGVHGVTGNVVGTTDTQDLSNKRIIDTLYFTDGVTIANEAEISVKPTTHEFEIKANYGDLDLKAVATGADVNITSDSGRVDITASGKINIASSTSDIVLNAGGASYLNGADPGNEIATKSDIDDLTTDDIEEVNGATNLYYTDSRARQAVSAGDGINYSANTGEISADLGNGLQIDGTGQIEIDNNVVATQTDLSDDIDAHSDLTTGVHGVSGDVVGTTDVQALTNKTLGADTSLSEDLDASENKIVNLATPTDAFDAATKAYVDAKAEGLSVKPAVMAATTANLASTYDNGTLGVGATLTSTSNGAFPLIDGVQLSTLSGQRGLLVKNQTDATQNGRYNLTTLGDVNTPWVLTRCGLCDEVTEIPSAYVFVQGGDLYEATGWAAFVENPTTFVVGDDNISWFQFAGAGTYLAGNGLNLDGNTFSIDDTITATKTYVDTNFVNVADLPGELDDYVLITQKGAADGVATLDEDGQVPVTQLAHVTEAIDGLSTDDIEEGDTNLYFTDVRAVDALEAVVPKFTEVEVTGGYTGFVSRQVVFKSNVSDPDTPTISFLKSEYRSAKYLVKVAYGTHTELSEVLLTLDTSDNIAITEYAVVGTNGSLATISADVAVVSGKVRLLITPANANSTVTITGTWLA